MDQSNGLGLGVPQTICIGLTNAIYRCGGGLGWLTDMGIDRTQRHEHGRVLCRNAVRLILPIEKYSWAIVEKLLREQLGHG